MRSLSLNQLSYVFQRFLTVHIYYQDIVIIVQKKSSENFGITKRHLWKDCYSMSSNLVFRTHQDNHLKRLRPPKSPFKTSEQINSFWGRKAVKKKLGWSTIFHELKGVVNKRDQNLKFTPLSETTSIPTPLICGVHPPGDGHGLKLQ